MIRKIKHSEIDFIKYSLCLETSEQDGFFASAKYLNTLIGDQWEILVEDDYNAVMPVPTVKKMGISFVMMPMQTQQLGIFSGVDNPEQNEAFLQFLKKNYHIYYYAFNAKNKFLNVYPQKKNFFLASKPYEEVKKNYSVHRRRNVRITAFLKDKIRFSERENLEETKDFFVRNTLGTPSRMVHRFFGNMCLFKEKGMLRVFDLYFEDNLISQAYLIENKKGQALVNFLNDKKWSKINGSSLILDQIFQRFIHERNFNFHGSNIPAVADFYRRFGATEELYMYVQNGKWKLLTEILSPF